MSHLLKLKRADGVGNSLICPDLEYERVLRSLRAPSEICAEENQSRVTNRRFSDVLPLQVPFTVVEAGPTDTAVTHIGDCVAHRTASAPLPNKVTTHLNNAFTVTFTRSLDKQDKRDTLVPLYPCSSGSSPNTHSPASDVAGSPTNQNPSINAPPSQTHSVTIRAHMPSQCSKSHPHTHLASHTPCLPSATPSYLPREGSTSSLLSLEARDSSIRIVKPDLTLSPSYKARDPIPQTLNGATYSASSKIVNKYQAAMYGSKQNGQASLKSQESSYNGAGVHTRSHSRSVSECRQSIDAPEGYNCARDHSRGSSILNPDHNIRNGSLRSDSTDRGRTMQRRYEFIDNDDKAHQVLSPVHETAKKDIDNVNSKIFRNIGHESSMTTVTDLMQQCVEHLPQPPALQNHRQKLTNGAVDTSATQVSLSQAKAKQRPPALNLRNPVHIGMVNRNTNRYQIEHTAIKSSKAEHFDSYSPSDNTPVYDCTEDSPAIAPLTIPKYSNIDPASPLRSYIEWRQNLKPVYTPSQSSIRVMIPTQEEEMFAVKKRVGDGHRQIVGPHGTRIPYALSNMRSRSALGIREDGNEDRYRQLSGDSGYTASEYSAEKTPGRGSGITRSATINEGPHRDRQFSGDSESKISQSGTVIDSVNPPKETASSSPFTPLTPFIMRASGAPVGVEQGTKTLFGKHGWLEDTAALGVKKSKIERTGRFMESLKRKAREIADSTSFKPARHSRASSVSHMNISLDARQQSLLYCELEYNLNTALDTYFRTQLNTGRLEASKLSRIADAWVQKGRPKVIGFRYDLETQVDLITAHINEFRFYGPAQAEGPAAVTGLLYAMKSNARSMRIRTFCQPDSVIAKHVLDSQNLLRLLGSPESLQRPLEEVAQFFKVAVDRNRAMAEAPAGRQGGGRDFSDGSTRIISNGSGQRVRFQDDGERSRPRVDIPGVGISRSAVRGQNNGSVRSQSVKPQNASRGVDH
ncbi:hypothetical protein F5B22DRAFT_654029 [Xylaria bambusicola]|uniref:uncharacterized protein n=1 Tax=Xylaria bambusicola TaxID=326684 RepID=UPI002007611B|nr:uncharacterized protein F5B22DRAFT_654029 [Xylaria bambusicola]KAI0518545.1 hypothetical protein F5B22DRAFT_654029 [Xylaria bambusicola]